MKRLLPLLLILMVLLSACAKSPVETTPTDTQGTVPPTTTTLPTTQPPATTAPTDPSQSEVTQPELNYLHPLTGEALAEPMLQRPVAVMLNNIVAAMPQHGVSQADILYEVLAEGGITRCVGIFTDLESVEKVGSIRSARKYFVQIAQGYGAAYVHAGGSNEANAYLNTLKNMDLDAGLSATYFYRDQDRLNSGYSLEHTLFSSGEKILAFAKQRGVTTSLDAEKPYGMSFDDTKVIAGKSAKKVTVYFNMGGKPSSYTKSTAFTYDENTKLYSAAQYGGDYIDGNTKKAIAFRNVIALYASTSVQSDGKLLTINTVGSGTGHFASNGQMVNIKWSRASVNDPFTFTLENGSPLTFGVGATYIGVVPTGATVNFE
ncbi:MAG: DUF3048 domain-containing protein [Oscillospiraceae bacterium]|nr:DUF3048 domain-containing protein [Oscillospiraceae bacterium]